MSWIVTFLDDRVEQELDDQPKDIRAKFDRIRELIQEHGLQRIPGKYVSHIKDRLWELRLKGKDGIARALYVTAVAGEW